MNEKDRKSVMEEAEGLVNGARAAAYGHPKENFERIIALWQAYLDNREGGRMAPLTCQDHAIMMVAVKIARLMETPEHRDSAVDICGYMGTIEKLWARAQDERSILASGTAGG